MILHEVAAATPEEELPRIADAIAAAVQHEHGIALFDVVLLSARSLAKTSSGKIQRLASRTAYTAGQVEGELYRRATAAPARRGQRQLTFPSRAELLALSREQRVDEIERALSLFGRGEGDTPATMVAELDLDSLAAVDLAFRIEEQLGAVTDPSLLLQPTSLREVAAAIEERTRTFPEAPVRQDSGQRGGAVPLSAGQQSLLFMRELEGPDCRQNVSVAVRLREPVDVAVLSAAVRQLGTRHPILTSSFGTDGSCARI
ncbi:phosphopantetheine-binding protein [Streptomyces kaempferi]